MNVMKKVVWPIKLSHAEFAQYEADAHHMNYCITAYETRGLATASIWFNKLLLLRSGVIAEFAGISSNDPNCVVLGDATHEFTYDRMNQAFRVLINSDKPLLITLGEG